MQKTPLCRQKRLFLVKKNYCRFTWKGCRPKFKKQNKNEGLPNREKDTEKGFIETCLEGLHARLTKLKEKEAVLLKHQKEGTIPPVIFGGKKNFYERLKGKITNQEWKELRSNTLYSRGDKSKKGNLNTRIVFDDQDQQFYLEVANPLLAEKGKNSPRLRFKLRIPDKYLAEMVDVVMPTI